MPDNLIAEAFVEFGAKDTALVASMGRVKESLKEFEFSFAKFATIGKAAFLSIAGAAIFLTKKAMDSTDAFEKLRVALQGDEKAAEDLEAFAKQLELITKYSKDAIGTGMAYAANLGVQADQMKELTEVGIGLAQKFFGGDLQAGMKAAALATNGNFRELERLIHSLRNTTDIYAKLRMVQEEGKEGFNQAQEINTTSKALSQLWNQLSEVAEAFGKILLPYIREAAHWFESLAIKLRSLTPEQTKQIVKWVAIGAAIAGVIGFAPEIAAFGSIVIGTFRVMGTAVLKFASILGSALLSPFGLVIAGIAAVATGFAYLIGTGDTAVKRIGSGFVTMASFLDHLFGSWKGFVAGVNMLWDQLGSYLLEGWIVVKNFLLDSWESMAEGIETAWWDAFKGMNLAWSFMKTEAQKFITWFTASWQSMTDKIGDLFYDTYAKIFAKQNGMSDQEAAAYLKQERERDKAAKDKQYGITQSNIDKNYDKDSKSITDSFNTARDEAQKKRRAARDKNDKQAGDDLAYAEQARQKNFKAEMDKVNAMPKLSDEIKALYDKIKSGAGFDEIEGLIAQINQQAKDLKEQAKKDAAAGGKGNLRLGANAARGPLQMEDIGETFKRMSAMRLVGAVGAMNAEQIAQQHLNETQKTNAKLDKVNKNLENINRQKGYARAA